MSKKCIRNTRMRDIRLQREWTKLFMDKMWNDSEIFSHRNIVYIYQPQDDDFPAGKSSFCTWLVQEMGRTSDRIDKNIYTINEKGEVVEDNIKNRYPVYESCYIQNNNRELFDTDACFRNLIYKSFTDSKECDRLFSGNTLIVDLYFGQELDSTILRTLELFKDGVLINSMPTLNAIRILQPNRVIVFGRQKPNIGWWEKDNEKYVFRHTIAPDRWVIFKLVPIKLENGSSDHQLERQQWESFKPECPTN